MILGFIRDKTSSWAKVHNSDMLRSILEAYCDESVTPIMIIPPGDYYFDDGVAIPGRDVFIRGSGTTLHFQGGCAFRLLDKLDPFDDSPPSLYSDVAQGFTMRDININMLDGGDAIQDLGNGAIDIQNVKFKGGGVICEYGSDFNFIQNVSFVRAERGLVLGPGSQQATINHVQFFGCERGLELHQISQAAVSSAHFVDSGIHDIVISSNDISEHKLGGTERALCSLSFSNTWHEMHSGGKGFKPSRTLYPESLISIEGLPDSSKYMPRNIHFRHASFHGGQGEESAINSFIKVSKGTSIKLKDFVVKGRGLHSVFDVTDAPWAKDKCTVEGLQVMDGALHPTIYFEDQS